MGWMILSMRSNYAYLKRPFSVCQLVRSVAAVVALLPERALCWSRRCRCEDTSK